MVIDASSIGTATYVLEIESFDGSDQLTQTLRTDTIHLVVTNYIRDSAIETVLVVLQGTQLTYNIPNCFSNEST